MLYYTDYDPAKNQRFVLAYDEAKHGPAQVLNGHTVFLFHRSIIASAVYESEEKALIAWGKYSRKPVTMPDGGEVVPAQYFGVGTGGDDIFIPWACVRGEKWPGEV